MGESEKIYEGDDVLSGSFFEFSLHFQAPKKGGIHCSFYQLYMNDSVKLG
jgi:hypothetical protein